jgi:amino acid permease
MDRLFFSNLELCGFNKKPRLWWMCLTGIMAVTAFIVSNAIPFFKDLVALIGALTSVPLTLLLPAIFYRQYVQVALWCPTRQSLVSWTLVIYALVFMGTAIAGAVSSIEMDWADHGGPFACN